MLLPLGGMDPRVASATLLPLGGMDPRVADGVGIHSRLLVGGEFGGGAGWRSVLFF